jgi:hypothetical protein
MGTWGIGVFENDTALDWLADFEYHDLRLIDRTLAGVGNMTAADHLDADEASEVLAAAECVAAAGGFATPNLPDVVTDWVAQNQPIRLRAQLVAAAQTAVAHVFARSELNDLWQETDEWPQWQAIVTDLQARLAQVGGRNDD